MSGSIHQSISIQMIEFTVGAYLGIVYTHAYMMYNSRIFEPVDGWDIMFFLLAPISYPICFIASLVNNK